MMNDLLTTHDTSSQIEALDDRVAKLAMGWHMHDSVHRYISLTR
jgi:hypothetical protein